MKAKDLRELNANELHEKISELRKELMKYYAQVSTGTIPKSPAKIKQAKKNVARIKTILHQQEVKK